MDHYEQFVGMQAETALRHVASRYAYDHNAETDAAAAIARKGDLMAKKQYPLRVDPLLWEAVERWAADELRSVNGQMEFIIRDSLKRAGRLPEKLPPARTNTRHG